MVKSLFDYIIVGAGIADCILANRLSENSANSVLLLESGRNSMQDTVFKSLSPVNCDFLFDLRYISSREPMLRRGVHHPNCLQFSGLACQWIIRTGRLAQFIFESSGCGIYQTRRVRLQYRISFKSGGVSILKFSQCFSATFRKACKSAGVSIGIEKSEVSESKSLSPVINALAFPTRASSRKHLSFGSLHFGTIGGFDIVTGSHQVR